MLGCVMVDLIKIVCDRLNGAGLGIEFGVVGGIGFFYDTPYLRSAYLRSAGMVGDCPYVRIDFEDGFVRVWFLKSQLRDFLIADPDFFDDLIGYIASYTIGGGDGDGDDVILVGSIGGV